MTRDLPRLDALPFLRVWRGLMSEDEVDHRTCPFARGASLLFKLPSTFPLSFLLLFIMASRSSALLRCLSRPGPSRLASRQLPCQVCLREASTSESAGSQAVESDSVAHAADDVGSAAPAAQAAPSVAPSERRPASVDGYDSWLKSVGIKYRDPPNNGPNWLGGEVVR